MFIIHNYVTNLLSIWLSLDENSVSHCFFVSHYTVYIIYNCYSTSVSFLFFHYITKFFQISPFCISEYPIKQMFYRLSYLFVALFFLSFIIHFAITCILWWVFSIFPIQSIVFMIITLVWISFPDSPNRYHRILTKVFIVKLCRNYIT